MTDKEIRVTSPTGAQKGTKLARYDLIPVDALRQVAEHYGKGAKKYSERNWEAGYDWSLSYAALQRHANAFWNGEDVDEETQSHHMTGVIFHALALMEFDRTHREFDNRPSTGQKGNDDSDIDYNQYNHLAEVFDENPEKEKSNCPQGFNNCSCQNDPKVRTKNA